jgi:hypothetical protein
MALLRRFEMTKFKDFEPACEESVFDKAVSNSFPVPLNGKTVSVEIIKPLHGDGYIQYKGTGIRIRKATAREIDGVTYWKRY